MESKFLKKNIENAKGIKNKFDIEGKVSLVIGGNKGIGQAIAIGFAAAGADVCVVGRGPEGLQETKDAICSFGRKGSFISADVTKEENVIRVVDEVLEHYKKIDILVNSQGAGILGETPSFALENWEKVMDVNLKSVFLLCKYAGIQMLAQKSGKIINISSVRGFQGRANDSAYAPSKGAVNQLTRSLAIEWGKLGINVNALAPATTLTEMSEKVLSQKEYRDWVLSRLPMDRLVELDDIIGPAVFLASKASDFINGHIIPIDGGWLSA